jgi:hypothetical protein
MVNGNVYDFESLNLQLPSGQIVMLESVSYKDKKDDEVITGVNSLPLGIGRGEYSGDCEIEISRYEYEKAFASAKNAGGFYNLEPLQVIAKYGHKGQPVVTDKLKVHFTERDFSSKKGDKDLKIKIKGPITEPVESNGIKSYTAE